LTKQYVVSLDSMFTVKANSEEEIHEIALAKLKEILVSDMIQFAWEEDDIEFLEEDEDMIKFTTDIGEEVELTDEQLRTEAKSMIEFAMNEKDYTIDGIDAKMIAEDITGIFGKHGLSDKALEIIEEQLNSFK